MQNDIDLDADGEVNEVILSSAGVMETPFGIMKPWQAILCTVLGVLLFVIIAVFGK